jgi:hypothetical protein
MEKVCSNHPAIIQAIEWRSRHEKHVESLIKESQLSFPPCKEDINHPELWKGSSWKWLKELVSDL